MSFWKENGRHHTFIFVPSANWGAKALLMWWKPFIKTYYVFFFLFNPVYFYFVRHLYSFIFCLLCNLVSRFSSDYSCNWVNWYYRAMLKVDFAHHHLLNCTTTFHKPASALVSAASTIGFSQTLNCITHRTLIKNGKPWLQAMLLSCHDSNKLNKL